MSIHTNIPRLTSHNVADASAHERIIAQHLGQPPVETQMAMEGTGLTRTLTVDVVNRQQRRCDGVFLVLVCISTVTGGGPGGAQAVSPPSVGALVEEITMDQVFVFMTDARGQIEVDIMQSGTWNARVIHASVIGVVQAISV